MLKQKYTTVAQLHEINNKDIIEYFENASVYFCKLQRKVFHIFKNENITGKKTEYKKFRQDFMKEHNISRRTADSILKDVQGRMKALAELKKYEVSQKEQKIKNLKEEIEKLDKKISEFQEKMKNKMKVNHLKYWNLKKSRAFKKMRLNKFQMRLKQLKWETDTEANKNSTPLTYSIIRKNGRYYLHCTFEYRMEDKSSFLTRKEYGTIGVDFNKGFLAVSEIDKNGNLLNTKKMYYRFGQGSKTKSDLEKIILYIVRICIETGKDLCIENLNFKNTKSRASKGRTDKGKKYNNMLHSLAYSLFNRLVTNIAFRNKVDVKKVNPAWTSWIAENKFCNRMKLNIHNGAAFVIARRGLGIKDTVK